MLFIGTGGFYRGRGGNVDSLAPACSALAGLPLRSNGTPALANSFPCFTTCRFRDQQTFRRWASSLPLSRPHGLCRWQILFAFPKWLKSQTAQVSGWSFSSSRVKWGAQSRPVGTVDWRALAANTMACVRLRDTRLGQYWGPTPTRFRGWFPSAAHSARTDPAPGQRRPASAAAGCNSTNRRAATPR